MLEAARDDYASILEDKLRRPGHRIPATAALHAQHQHSQFSCDHGLVHNTDKGGGKELDISGTYDHRGYSPEETRSLRRLLKYPSRRADVEWGYMYHG
jgi:hypothetical protein